MKFTTINDVKAEGFTGFITMKELRMGNLDLLPETQGIYMVLMPEGLLPEFLPTGTGGHFKDKDPNVPIEELRNNWIEGTSVLYIGKAGGGTSSHTLRKRVKQYVRFGEGAKIGHWGGRYIWQLKNAEDLIVCWKSTTGGDAREIESELIQDFKIQHYGRRPFANLMD